MAYQMIALDIDGTLTNSQKQISDATKDALIAIQEKGIKVVLASGRPTPGLKECADILHLADYGSYLLSYNGAKITDCRTGEVIVNHTLPLNIPKEAYEFAIKENIGIITYENDGVIAETDIDHYMELEARINRIPLRKVQNFPAYVTFPVNKCLFTGDGDVLAEKEKLLLEKYGNTLSIYRSEPFFLEMMPQNVDKAQSLSRLLQHLGLDQNQLVACGDGYNDLSMISYAGLGVAMENAQDVVKEAADFITLSNDEDGICKVIEKFF